MDSIYVDTALLAIPNYAVSEATAQQLFERVIHFAQIIASRIPIRVVISDECDSLWELNLGPDHDQLSQFIDVLNLGHLYSAHDLIRIYNKILIQAERVASVKLCEILKFSAFRATPEISIGLGPAILVRHTERTLTTVAALEQLEGSWHFGSAFHDNADRSILIKATIEEVRPRERHGLGELPLNMVQTVRVVSHLKDIISEENAKRLWRNAETVEDIYFAIFVGALVITMTTGKGTDHQNLREFVIGPRFLQTLRDRQCFGSGRFASMTHGILSQIVANNCPQVPGKFGRPNQVVRNFDGALGWRVHLTKGSEALRLMYWECDGKIEFANVDVKHTLIIEHGRPGGGLSIDLTECLT